MYHAVETGTHGKPTVHLIGLSTRRCYEPQFTKTEWATNSEEPSHYLN